MEQSSHLIGCALAGCENYSSLGYHGSSLRKRVLPVLVPSPVLGTCFRVEFSRMRHTTLWRGDGKGP